MATTNTWDLRAGFTSGYDLATSAVTAADRQFNDAQRIVDNAYKLDKTAATQQLEIERMNAENLEKTMASQARVGDFESAQEIQRALESLGTATVEDPEVQQAQEQQQQQQQTPEPLMTDDGRIIEDPNAPIIAAPNTQKPPVAQPRVRPMTRREQLAAIEPMLKTPKAKYALRQMVQKEATSEALALHTVAPDQAFNMLIKEGVLRGTPLTANDDGTFSRLMPDGKNMLRLDRTEASAFVGDAINKTNNLFKLSEDKLKNEQKLMYGTQMEANKSKFRQDDEVQKAALRSELERQKADLQAKLDSIKTGNDAGLIRLRAGLEGGNIRLKAGLDGKGGDDAQTSTAGSAVSGASVAEPAQAQRIIENLTPEEISKKLEQAKEGERKALASGDIRRATQYREISSQLQSVSAKAGDVGRMYSEMFDGGLKEIAKIRSPKGKIEYNKEIQKLKRDTNKALERNEAVDAKELMKQIDEIVARAKEK